MPIDKITTKLQSFTKNNIEDLALKKIKPDINCDIKKLEEELDSIANNNSAFLFKRINLPKNPIYHKYDSIDTQKNTGIFQKICSNLHEKFIAAINSKLDLKIQEFYSTYRTKSEILIFERNLETIRNFLNKKPKECCLSSKEYKKIINNLCDNLEKEEENLSLPDSIFSNIKKEAIYKIDRDYAAKIYYSQEQFLNPDFEKIKAAIRPADFQLHGRETKEAELVGKILESSKDLTLDSGSLIEKEYNNDVFYDLPQKFATACYNTLEKNANAYIIDNIPEMFKGINREKLTEKFDLLSVLTKKYDIPKGIKINFEIDGNKFYALALDSGEEAATFRIISQNGDSVIFKNYLTNSDKSPSRITFAPQGLYGNLSILREANMAGVSDVAKLYMANPIFSAVESLDSKLSKFKGGWMIVEDASKRKQTEGLKFKDWFKQHGLNAFDDKESSWINGICVDTGFIYPPNLHHFYCCGWGNYEINKAYSKYLEGKTTKEILSEINNY